MRYIKLAIPVIVMMMAASCDSIGKKGDGNSEGGDTPAAPKQFKSAGEAANAAKEDMLSAIDKVNFGVSAEQLKASAPGAPVVRYNVDWDALMRADSNINPEGMAKGEATTIVPLLNNNSVVAVIGLQQKGQEYSIAAVGDKQVSSELDIVRKADSNGMQEEINIYEVPNLQATIYAVGKGEARKYYTSYNNNSLREPMNNARLFKMLKADAMLFQRQFGEELKKGNLVK